MTEVTHLYPGTGATIVVALVRNGDSVLLVEQQAPHDAAPSWALPAGGVEPGESPVDALAREIREETGLSMTGVPKIAFEVRYVREGRAWLAMTFDCEASGEIRPNDPDGLVLSARWVSVEEALSRLVGPDWYDPEPLTRWLTGNAERGATYLAESD